MIPEETIESVKETSAEEIIISAENIEDAIESSSFENLDEEIPLEEE